VWLVHKVLLFVCLVKQKNQMNQTNQMNQICYIAATPLSITRRRHGLPTSLNRQN
jgi:hypothetical protein